MTFWAWMDRRWPTERQWVTIALVATLWIMLQMATDDPRLWDVKLFEIILQGVVLTGLLNMVLAYHFAANKDDATKAENTGKAFDALKATAEAASVDRPTGNPGDPLSVTEER